jgi:hypothetical protein
MAAPRRPSSGPVYAVGHIATIAGSAGDAQDVRLMDASALVSHGTVARGARVEILAWQPSAADGTRYRVRSSSDGIEGWVDARQLRMDTPPSPARPASAAPAKRIVGVRKKPVAKAAVTAK